MSSRRFHPRFVLATAWDAAMRVLREVIIHRTADDELLAISTAPGIVGEEMCLDLMSTGESLQLKVRVIESHPAILDGSVRHRIRLSVMPEPPRETSAGGRTEAGEQGHVELLDGRRAEAV